LKRFVFKAEKEQPKLHQGLLEYVTAIVAFAIMHTNNAAAAWATITFRLDFKKFFHAFLFYHFDVFNHAHTVAFAVALVKMCKLRAGNRVTLAARLDFMFSEFSTSTFDIAVFSSWQAACTISDFASYPRNTMCVGKVGFAYGAVHAAGGDEFRIEFCLGH
jgi:hypothetical protein